MLSKYQCIIADDTMLDRDVLEMYARKIGSLEIAAVCRDGLEAASVLQEKQIDIVLSDIEMPGLTGMELKKSLRNDPVFIFVSSHSELAAESYNLDVIDFIVKPVNLPRLLKAVNKAIEYIEVKKQALPGGDKKDNVPAEPQTPKSDHFYIKESYDYTRIDYDDLIYIESMGNFSSLHTVQKQKHITLVSLKNIEQQLPAEKFIRVHKQNLVNLQHIVSLSSDNNLHLSSGHMVPVGENYKGALMEIINRQILLR